jgi:hypothetical protein
VLATLTAELAQRGETSTGVVDDLSVRFGGILVVWEPDPREARANRPRGGAALNERAETT